MTPRSGSRATSPADDATNAQTTGNLVATFCEVIQAGTGFIRLYRADDALFMGAYAAMEAYQDLSVAARLLDKLISEYPDSEFKADAEYLRENLYNPTVRNPTTVDDLRRSN